MMKIAVTNRTICYRLHGGDTDAVSRPPDYQSSDALSAKAMGASANSQLTSGNNFLQNPVIRCLLQQIRKLRTDGTYEKILLREKDLPMQDYLALAEAVFSVWTDHGNHRTDRQTHCYDARTGNPIDADFPVVAPLIFHNFPEAAERFGTDLHLPFSVFRELADSIRSDYPHIKKIGTSVHSAEDAVYAEAHGADYVIAGHIFATDCKQGLPGRGADWLRSVCDAVSVPVFAIGGISEETLPALSDCPIAGVCMMSEAML